MKRFDLKEHNKKYFEISKKAANGTYPSKKVANAGSKIGLGLGTALIISGGIGITKNQTFGWGSLIAGSATMISNVFNLRRISSK